VKTRAYNVVKLRPPHRPGDDPSPDADSIANTARYPPLQTISREAKYGISWCGTTLPPRWRSTGEAPRPSDTISSPRTMVVDPDISGICRAGSYRTEADRSGSRAFRSERSAARGPTIIREVEASCAEGVVESTRTPVDNPGSEPQGEAIDFLESRSDLTV